MSPSKGKRSMIRQVVVVTGAAGGFGSAIAKSLIEVGYYVAATDNNAESLELLYQDLGCPDKLKTFVMDVADFNSVVSTSKIISETMGKYLCVLVNNAGILEKKFCLNENNTQKSKQIIDVNLTGAFNCTTVFAKYMAKLQYGRIINIASIAGIWGASGGAAYAASKAGLIKASESWARELGPMNISVTAIAPGVCRTKMYKKFLKNEIEGTDSEQKVVKSLVPTGRLGTPEDVAEVVTFLATCNTNYLSGAVIAMDGAMRIGSI
jgi:3-oxoacyl-[acyl-carrier protein] reductase